MNDDTGRFSIAAMLEQLEPAACDSYRDIPLDVATRCSIAISLKRIADLLDGFSPLLEIIKAQAGQATMRKN